MQRPPALTILLLIVMATAGCEKPSRRLDDDGTDSGVAADSGFVNTGVVDSGVVDTGEPLTFVPIPAGLDPQTLARATVVLATCLPDDGLRWATRDYYFSPSVQRDKFFNANHLRCLADADDGCAALDRCTDVRFDRNGPCEAECVGNTLTACDDSLRFIVDCASRGLVCDVQQQDCVSSSGAVCDARTFESTCVDGAPRGCSDDRELGGYDCDRYGLTCNTNPSGSPGGTCSGTGGECQSFGYATFGLVTESISCTNTENLLACVNSGLHTIRCSDIATDFGCHSVSGYAFCGLSSVCDPNDINLTASCDGETLVFCNAGRLERIDCTSLGFTGCSVGDWPASAYCSPSSFQP